jgi:hypothetical protein
MSFTTTLSRYELLERPAVAPTGTGIGTAGWQAQFDVINALTGETIVAASTTPRASAIAALTGANVAATAIVQYVNSSGSTVYERPLSLAN